VLHEPERRFGVGFESDMLVNHIVSWVQDQPGLTVGWRAFGSGDGTVRLWGISDQTQVGAAFNGHTQSVTSLT
jgi:hypothetical protein